MKQKFLRPKKLNLVNGFRLITFLVVVFYEGGLHAQPMTSPAPGSLSALYSTIQAQEANFPLPVTEQTINVGTIDLANPSAVATLNYTISKYTDGSTHRVLERHALPCEAQPPIFGPQPFTPVFGTGPCLTAYEVPNYGGSLTVANILHLNLSFAISNWRTFNGQPSSITVQLGPQSQTVPAGTTSVLFKNVSETSPVLKITVNGGLLQNGVPVPVEIPGTLPTKITWVTAAVGAATIPVLPVSIIYSPLVDPEKKNTATAAISTTSGNTTTISFSNQSSVSTPIPTSFESITDLQSGMSTLGSALSKVPNPIVAGVGSAMTTIASGLGSSTATQNLGTEVTNQRSLSVAMTKSLSQTALASQGGPGEGDLITYYYNARVIWYSDGSKLQLGYLGSDGLVQATASELKSARTRLVTSAPTSIDSVTHLNLASVSALLKLDPFADGGAMSVLPPDRFVPIDGGEIIEVGGGSITNTFGHQTTSTDVDVVAQSTTDTQIDKAGFLSFLGIGVTDNKTIQTQILQSSSAQTTSGESFTTTFTLNGESSGFYSGRVYFDVVFGSFAFQELPNEQLAATIGGTISNKQGRLEPNTFVRASFAKERFLTESDSSGHFSLRLPVATIGNLNIEWASQQAHLNFQGQSIGNAKIVPQ